MGANRQKRAPDGAFGALPRPRQVWDSPGYLEKEKASLSRAFTVGRYGQCQERYAAPNIRLRWHSLLKTKR